MSKTATLDLSLFSDPSFMNPKIYEVFHRHYLSKDQPELFPWSQINIKGGTGGGKTNSILKGLLLLMLTEPKQHIVMVRDIFNSMRDSTHAEMRIILATSGLGPLFIMNQTTGEIRLSPLAKSMLPDNFHANDIISKGAQDTNQFFGLNATVSYYNEFIDASKSDWSILRNRTRVNNGRPNFVITDFNPRNETSWIKDFFEDTPTANIMAKTLNFSVHPWENLQNTQEYLDMLRGLKDEGDEYGYNVYWLGEWGSAQGLIFDQNKMHLHGEVDPETGNIINELSMKPEDYIAMVIGLDWGWDHKFAMVLLGIRRNGDLCLLNELTSRQSTNPELMELFRHSDLPKDIWIIADSEAPDKAKEWKDCGFKVDLANKGPGSVEMGIDYIRRTQVHANRFRVPETIKEWKSYRWKVLKDGTVDRKPVAINDDCIACVRYGTETYHTTKAIKRGFRQL